MKIDATYLPIGIFIEDEKGEIVEFNIKYAEILGAFSKIETNDKISSLAPYSLMNQNLNHKINWRDHLYESERENILNEWEKQKRSQKTIHKVFRLKKFMGSEIWVDIKAVPLNENGISKGYAGILTDITNQKMFETVLERFKKAVEKSQSQIIFTDPQGIILYANEGAEKTSGFTSAELVGTKAGKLWGGLMDKDFYKRLWEQISVQKQPFSSELINKKKSGETYYAEVNITPVLDENGEIEFFVGIERDITYIKEVDKVKSEFISLASHQLRTPLSSVKWLCELFWQENSENLSPDQKEIVAKIQEENQRLIKLVNSLLDVSRIEAKKINVNPQKTDFNNLVKDVVANFKKQIIEKGINLNEIYQDNLPSVFVDPKLASEAVKNLISNAVKYTPTNGSITIETKQKLDDILLKVSDTGIGIPINDQRHIFERFFRASNAYKTLTDGNGLGLYFTKWVASEHGGNVWFESQENVGTTFYISFPILGKKL